MIPKGFEHTEGLSNLSHCIQSPATNHGSGFRVLKGLEEKQEGVGGVCSEDRKTLARLEISLVPSFITTKGL